MFTGENSHITLKKIADFHLVQVFSLFVYFQYMLKTGKFI